MNKKGIAILGSTGSIGRQTLEVIEEQKDLFYVEVLTANQNADLLIRQAKKFLPNTVVIVDETKYGFVSSALKKTSIKVYAGESSLEDVVSMSGIDLVVTALVGYSGLKPTLKAIECGKEIALANKETLVVAGGLISLMVKQHGSRIYPVDSEHSAIFQCLAGEVNNPVEMIYLTASGGPFRGCGVGQLESVTKKEALRHPNWNMGAKITIDSATLMNKGLEVIEAKWLFDLELEKIEVVVHPESIIHSAVQFQDGSIKAQLGLPDMKLPIQYALSYPKRLNNSFPRFSFFDYPKLTFEKPKKDVFECLELAFKSIKKGGNSPCVLNAANEVAVAAFLENKIGFLNIPDLIADCMEKITFVSKPTLDDYIETNLATRRLAKKLL